MSNFKDAVEIIAGLGTFISAVVAAYTLKEVKRQRMAMYKPELFLNSFAVTPNANPLIREGLIFYKTKKYNDYSEKIENVEQYISVHYKLENLGFGVAKDVICTWEFDYARAASLLRSKLYEGFELREISTLNSYFLSNRNDDNFHRSASFDSILKSDTQKWDFISPIQVQDNTSKHTVPEVVIFMHFYFLIFSKHLVQKESNQFWGDEFEEFPKPLLQIRCKDLNNEIHTKTYQFNVSAVTTQIDDRIDTSKEFCLFQFEAVAV